MVKGWRRWGVGEGRRTSGGPSWRPPAPVMSGGQHIIKQYERGHEDPAAVLPVRHLVINAVPLYSWSRIYAWLTCDVMVDVCCLVGSYPAIDVPKLSSTRLGHFKKIGLSIHSSADLYKNFLWWCISKNFRKYLYIECLKPIRLPPKLISSSEIVSISCELFCRELMLEICLGRVVCWGLCGRDLDLW